MKMRCYQETNISEYSYRINQKLTQLNQLPNFIVLRKRDLNKNSAKYEQRTDARARNYFSRKMSLNLCIQSFHDFSLKY